MIDLNDALATSGGVTLKPETIGETLGGIIVAAEVRQATDFTTGKPDFWDDGKPKNQIVVTVKTGAKTDDGDDEQGNVYIKTWGEQKQALVSAIKATGLGDANAALAPGNDFRITYRGEKPNQNPRFNAVKLYEYTITPRADIGGVLDGGVLDDTPAQAPTPAQAQAAAPEPANSPVDTARKLIAAGLDDQTIATTTSLDPAVIAALRAN